MQYLFLYFIISLVAVAAQAGEKQQHYQVEAPATYGQALHQLQHETVQVEKALERGDLHKIHEKSYVMEAAIKRMQDDLAMIAEAVEVMHLASEKKENEKAAKAVSKLQPAVKALSAE